MGNGGGSDNLGRARRILMGVQENAIPLDVFEEGARWWSNAGVWYSLADFVSLVSSVHGASTNGIPLSIETEIVSDHYVVIEATSDAQLANGKDYRNRYAFIFEFANGKVRAVKEYADTQHAAEAFS